MIARVRPFPARPLDPVADDECHVWAFPLDGPADASTLSIEERERADRYKLDRVRRQFVGGRGRLRALLGGYLGVRPERVPLTVTAGGKPVLTGDPLRFNVSHSGDVGLIAVARLRVGLDVEVVRDVPTADGLVGRFFAAEEQAEYTNLPDGLRRDAFLRGWTCKEAVLKAVGVGLNDVQECWVDLDPRTPPRVRRLGHPPAAGLSWQLAAWSPRPGYVAALAAEAAGPIELRCD